MNLYLRLAWRNIWRHKRRTLIVVLAIGLSMSMLMMYDGVVAGFEQAIYANAIRVFGGNIQVHAPGYRGHEDDTPLLPLVDDQAVLDAARARPEVLVASRRIQTSGIITSREGAFGVNIIGIEPEVEQPTSLLAQNISAGRFLSGGDIDMIFIGQGLANAMDVAVGDRVSLAGKTINDQMRQRTMTVAGIYDLSLPDVEKGVIYITLAEAQELYEMDGQVSEVTISLKQLGEEAPVIEAISAKLPGYEIESWEANYPELKAALTTKGGVMNVFSVVIIMIAGIGILNMLLMAVFERTREIGVLGALGMKPGQISLLFLLEGALMGLVGVAFGIALGLAFNLTLKQVGLDYSQFTSVTEYTALISGRIYPSLGIEKLLNHSLTVLIIALLASYYPAREAARLEPAQALHTV